MRNIVLGFRKTSKCIVSVRCGNQRSVSGLTAPNLIQISDDSALKSVIEKFGEQIHEAFGFFSEIFK